jgi:hypothetical protein
MTSRIRSLARRASAPLFVLFLMGSAVGCFADSYSNEGTVYITGAITDIQNQATCDRYDCHIGSSWNLWVTFQAPDWNAPDSNYLISTVLLNCFGGPPCIDGYGASSDFGWAPYGFDILSVDIKGGKVVDARASCGGYFIESVRADIWAYVGAFSGRTTGYATPTPEPATVLALVTGMALIRIRRYPMRWLRSHDPY